ncbi:MAG: ATP-binding protein [Planctomycetota bacterium]
MAERNWGLITSGATFQALAITLVFFEDSKAALFGRPGKDGGQDARSGDGIRVFQAKHHADGSPAKAIADAKQEAAKIREYRKPGHPRCDQWKSVSHWRLVTNADFNPTDRLTWDTEVVPLFSAEGLTADYWARANLDALLDKYPDVDRAFFQNETRAFLSLQEVRERLPLEQPFLQRASSTRFLGRENEIGQVRDFLASEALFLVLHGAGGIGKTRLLIEAGEEIAAQGSWQVLWANVATMSATATWLQGSVPERQTLLLVDEPDDEQLLTVLVEQLGGTFGRTAAWKVAVAVRSPKDPVLRFLFGPKLKARVRELLIHALPTEAAEGMCRDLLATSGLSTRAEAWRNEAARELANRFSQHPVWLALAVHLLEAHGDVSRLPQSAADLASLYVDEIVGSQKDAPRDQILALLRWVALIGTVNREDEAALRLLCDGTGIGNETVVRMLLARLVERRALVQRGARDRLVEVKPDVVRDHLLLSWLVVDVGYGEHRLLPSADAKTLVATVRDAVLRGNISALGRAILTALARTELLLRLSEQPVDLLMPFFAGIVQALPDVSAGCRLVITEVLSEVATIRPSDTVTLSRALRTCIVASETTQGIFGTREVGQDDVVLTLAWPLYHAAMGAQTPREAEQVLEELCTVAVAEAEIATRRSSRQPNDGRRAAQLVGQAIHGGPQFWGDFEDAVKKLGERLLAQVAQHPPTLGQQAAMKALLEPALAAERRQMWSEGYTVQIQTHVVVEGHPAWTTRQLLLTRVRNILADASVPLDTRVVLWRLLAEAHRSANRCRLRGPPQSRRRFARSCLPT